jgi:hypothetical protein
MAQLRHSLLVLPDLFAICRLDRSAPLPAWALSGSFYSITGTADELSIVCSQHLVPEGVRCERGWRALRVVGTMDFSLTGVVASLVKPLADAGISVFVISTFDTDYLLVKENCLERALTALRNAGHEAQ